MPERAAREWEPWLGRSATRTAWLDPEQANRMNVTLDRDPCFAAGDALPPAWHWLYFHELVRAAQLGPEGHPRLGLFMPPVSLPRRMWAGGSLRTERPLRLGDTAEQTSTITAVTEKQGRSGPLCFVTVRHELRTGGRPNLVEDQTIVYRDHEARPGPGQVQGRPDEGRPDQGRPDQGQRAGGEREPEPGPLTRRWELDSIALFRYSALTFNGHRIHYDADYCRQVEGYPGLVVHGPLLATLLLDLAAGSGRPVRSFEYRARSPLFLPGAFTVNGRPDGERTQLWAASADGRPAMQAESG